MFSDKITLDRETFKALSADTRIEILKTLDARKHTLSDIAEAFGMSPSTIKEHLDRLSSAGLVKQQDKGMKWKYYVLTDKGRSIIRPQETRVWIMLAVALFFMAASVINLVGFAQEAEFSAESFGGRTLVQAPHEGVLFGASKDAESENSVAPKKESELPQPAAFAQEKTKTLYASIVVLMVSAAAAGALAAKAKRK
jgi:DNA-binding transcriptional ArsR family regulator